MAYEYQSTKAERKAAALLRERGWSVSEPTCPLCHGFGMINDWQPITSDNTVVVSSTVHMKACPNGCQIGGWYFHSSQTWSETLEQNGWTLS